MGQQGCSAVSHMPYGSFLNQVLFLSDSATPLFSCIRARLYFLDTFVRVAQRLWASRQRLLFSPLRLSLISSAGLQTQVLDTFVLLCGSCSLTDLL